MAEDTGKDKGVGPSSSVPISEKKDTETPKKQQKGIISRIWNSLFRIHGDDFEKRLQNISKEEALVLARMKKRTHSWRRMARHLIVLSVIMEVSLAFSFCLQNGGKKCITRNFKYQYSYLYDKFVFHLFYISFLW